MPISSRKAIKILTKNGWHEARQRGSHKHFHHDDFDHPVTIPHPKKDLTPGVIKDIENKTSLKLK